MPRLQAVRQPCCHLLARLVHGLLLACWLLSSHGVAPVLVLAAAKADGDHRVEVGAQARGSVTLVLAHERAEAVEHQHGMLCELILRFAVNRGTTGPDHVLSFKSVDEHQVREAAAAAPLPATTPPVRVLARAPMPVLWKPAWHGTPARAWSPGPGVKKSRTRLVC
jgi:hypothetical protein